MSGNARAQSFFESFLAAPLILAMYLIWKIYSAFSKDPRINHRGWKLYVRTGEMDVHTGIRPGVLRTQEEIAELQEKRRNTSILQRILSIPLGLWRSLFAP